MNYPVSIEITVQWGDQDMFGHVNNVHYIRWFESARIEYLARCGADISGEGIGPILAAVHCDYRHQIRFPDKLTISTSATKIGEKSLTLSHQIWSEFHNQLAAEGHSVVVMFDYRNQHTVAIPDNIKRGISLIEN